MMNRRKLLKLGSMAGASALAGLAPLSIAADRKAPIPVGILHSLTGTLAI